MKIINTKNHSEYMHIRRGEKPFFSNPSVKTAFETQGIMIPAGLSKNYDGKKNITLDDPEFERAFREIYYAFQMDKNTYKLIEN